MSDRSGTPPAPDERLDADFEASLSGWLDARGRPDAAELATVRASIATLPARRSGRGRTWLGVAAAAVIVAVIGGLALSARIAPQPGAGTEGGPGAWASDPRLPLCGEPEDASAIFELAHFRDYRHAFPAIYEITGLSAGELDGSVLVYVSAVPSVSSRLVPPSSSSTGPSQATGHVVCFVTGRDASTWRLISAGGVDLTGFVPPAVSTDPAAWIGDPRYASCIQGHVAEPAQVFEMTHAQWFPLYFPGWSRGAPELEVDDPALVVIGREQHWPVLGAAPQPGQTVDPDAGLGYQMCIAVGPTSGFIVHDYGVTRFDRVVPVLSPEDVARAARLDPDVLADPAAWPFPERLAPCGGITGNELYIFEANPLRDFRRYFPAAHEIPAMDTEDSGIVIVFREPLPIRRRADSGTPGPAIHDVCVVFNTANPNGASAILPEIDITGFHLRLDGPSPTPDLPPSEAPVGPTPTPAPAWTSGAAALLGCGGQAAGPISGWARGRLGTTNQETAEHALNDLIDRVRETTIAFPLSGFRLTDEATDAAVYAYTSGGSYRAAVVLRSEAGDGSGPWFIADAASCPASELGDNETGVDLGVWRDAVGTRVPAEVISERQDCYNGIQLTVNGRLFVWDPDVGLNEIYDPAQLDATVAAEVPLPADAIDTGFRSSDRRLFLAKDGSTAFIVRTSGVQRWPHVKGDSYQRTDCN